jgi:hypothetical protein
MKIRSGLMAVAALAISAVVASASSLKLASFTGTVVIKTQEGKTITVKPGDKAPEINTGDQVSVESGQAVFESKGVKVSADAGSAFTLQPGKGVQIAASGTSPVMVSAGGDTASLKSGDAIQVSGKTLTVVAGSVPVTNSSGQTVTLNAGQSSAPASKPATRTESTSNNDTTETPVTQAPPPAPNPKQETKTVSPSAP